jgi:hypothetical protein
MQTMQPQPCEETPVDTGRSKSCKCDIYRSLVDEISEMVKRVETQRRETSCDFNLFEVLELSETGHSRFLASLLKQSGSHGQGKLFQLSFLKHLEVSTPEQGTWTVSCESNRIDICLERKEPHSIVIIENKCMGAGDRQNQLYRYWHRKLFKYHQKENDISLFYMKHKKEFKILYLVKHYHRPSEQTCERPESFEKTAPVRLPLEPTIKTIGELAREWLGGLLRDGIPLNNSRLRECVEKYVEYWKFCS